MNRHDGLWFMIGIITATILFLGLALAEDVNVSAGGSHAINCTATNETYNITCGYGPQMCIINRTLDGNENMTVTEGSCNVSVACEGIPWENQGKVVFPGYLRVEQSSNMSQLTWHVDDYNGVEWKHVVWNLSDEDVVIQERKIDFECPAEIKTNINFDTCAGFFTDFLNTQDTNVFSTMALSTTSCVQKLTDCQAEVLARQHLSQQYEKDYIEEVSRGDSIKDDLQQCKQDLLGPDGSCERDKNDFRIQLDDYKKNYVPGYWMTVAIGALAFLTLMVGYAFVGGSE